MDIMSVNGKGFDILTRLDYIASGARAMGLHGWIHITTSKGDFLVE